MALVNQALTLLGREALKIVLPSWCVVCREDLPWRDRMASCCGRCWAALPRLEGPACRTCALPLPAGDEGSRCIPCLTQESPLDRCLAWGHYRDGLERVLHAFKFERHDFLDDPLATLLAEIVPGQFDLLVPVPMTRAKERKRGYNQADLLARRLSRRMGIPHHPIVLTRVEERATQSSLDRKSRAANVRGVFAAKRGAAGRRILLVDDICTTAETLRECARVLRKQGAAEVSAVVVAKAS